MKNLSAWAIRSPIPTVVLFIALSLAGVAAFRRLPVNAYPDVALPAVSVAITQAGAAPSELEVAVTRRVEGAIAGVAGVKHVQSTLTDGLSQTNVEFNLGIDPDRATNDVRDAVARVREELPRDIDEPVVSRLDVDGGAILTYAVRAPALSAVDLSWFVDDTVGRELLAVPGVSQVTRLGGVSRELRVELDPSRLEALGITAAEVNAQLRLLNADLPGGRGEVGAREQAIRALGSAPTVEALGQTHLALPAGRWVRLADLGRVEDGASEARRLARLDGEPVVAFAVFRAKGSGEVAVARAVQARVAALAAARPGVTITRIASTVTDTLASYDAAMHTLVEGLVLAVLVVFWFLRDWRATLIAAIAMPLSLLPTFVAMVWLDFTLNQVSLLALTLVIGILVDDAIVEIENIVRHMGETGLRPYRASLEAADQIGLAVVATTMTIVVVFLPVSLMGGVVGQYFKQFGITVAVAVLASLLVARLLTPLLAAYFLRPGAGHPPGGKSGGTVPAAGLTGRYRRLLGWALEHRVTTLLAGAVFLAASLALVPLLPTGFTPPEDRLQSVINVELPPGSTLAETDHVTARYAAILRARPEVEHVFVSIGGAGEVHRAELTAILRPAGRGRLGQKALERHLRGELAQVADARWSFAGDGGNAREVSVILTGEDPATLARASQELETAMRALPQLANVQSTLPLPRPEIMVRPRTDEAARLGISATAIAETVRVATLGDTDALSAKSNLPDRQIPVRVQLTPAARGDLSTLENLRVSGSALTAVGAPVAVPLKSVAELTLGGGAARLDRFDRERKVALEADLNGGATLGTALAAVQALPAFRGLPAGVRERPYGDSEYMGEMFGQFGLAMAAGVLMSFAVLVLLFRDFLQPVTILTALPLSLGGAFSALLLTGRALDLPAFIGLLMLMGIVTKNSILLVDFAVEARRAGQPRHEALLEAGATRARPIIMTTIAMVAGMAPATLGLGSGAGFRAPMAIAVIGGLATSTLLSLVFVPVVYTFVDDLDRWLRPRLARLTTVGEADGPEREPAPI